MNAIFNLLQSVMSVIFPLITFPYISRIFGVDVLGKYNFSKNFVEMFSYVAMLGIPAYAAREGARIRGKRTEISKFSSEIFSMNIISSLFVLFVLFFSIIVSDSLHTYALLLFIFSITIPMTTIGMSWLFVIYEDYLFISVLSIIINCLSVMAMFLFVKTEADAYIYALVTVIASCGSNIIKFFYGQKYCEIRLTIRFNYKKHIKPIILLFSAYLSVMVYNKTDTALLGFICGDYNVGIYSVSAKIYSLVKSCLLSIISVLQTRAVILASKGTHEEQDHYLTKCFNTLGVLTIPCMVGLIFISNDIIELIAGNEYLEANTSLTILSIAVFFALFSTFYSSCVLNPHNKEQITLNGALIGAGVNLLLNFIAIPMFKENGAAMTTLIAEIAVFLFYLKYTRKYFKHRGIGSSIIKTVIGSCGIILILTALSDFHANVLIRVIIKVVFSALIYFAIELILKNKVVVDIYEELLHKCKRKVKGQN